MKYQDSELQTVRNEVRQLQNLFGAVNNLQGKDPFPRPKKYSHSAKAIKKELSR